MTGPVYSDGGVTVYVGDCIEVMRTMPADSVDSIVTDPPYGLGFMGKAWDALPPGLEWAEECLRVLKPGGHLLAFGGTRTWHRLAVAVEDAGFEMRDSIAWLYGSGFPKSLDVSKAIDRNRDDRAEVLGVTTRLADLAEASGITRADLDQRMGTSDMGGWWLSRLPHRCACPSVENWTRLRDIIPGAAELDAEVWRLNGRKGSPGEAWALRPITQAETAPLRSGEHITFDQRSSTERERRDIPATEAAQQWQGWGTALKPAHEPVVVAMKPLAIGQILARIGSHLDELEAEWLVLAAELITPTGGVAASYVQTDTSWSESTVNTGSSIVTSWRDCWAETCELMSTSTTSTADATITDLRTLWSWISRLTAVSMLEGETNQPGLTSIASVVETLFVSVVFGLRATHALSVAEIAIGSTPTEHQAGDAGSAFEPIVVARKPLRGTVAANVQQYGTGALNIDGCRIGDDGGARRGPEDVGVRGAPNLVLGAGLDLGNAAPRVPGLGRWPANVVLDEDQAAALDQQSGTRTSSKPTPGAAYGTYQDTGGNAILGRGLSSSVPNVAPYGDSGGASRFFYCAKAPKRERPVVDGVAHSTVKPLTLIRWLIRLVTPPGGVTLDTFAGSGTSVEAAMLEGFDCIAIERGGPEGTPESKYPLMIAERIWRQLTPTV